MNPEFRRNLILELTPHRMLAMPALLLMFYALAGISADRAGVASATETVSILLLVLWGTRLAADSVLGEVAGRTWDGQRMSALGPFALGWGKLLGSTAYVWYGVLVSVPAMLYGGVAGPGGMARLAMCGLFAQGAALFASLVLLRLRTANSRFQVMQAHMAGIIAGGAWWGLTTLDASRVVWYRVTWGYAEFVFAFGVAFLLWLGFGIFRLLREELQFRVWPVGWTAFVLFGAALVGGFSPADLVPRGAVSYSTAEFMRPAMAFAISVVLVWVAAFAAPKGYVRLSRWRNAVTAGDWRRVAQATPSWAPGIAIVLVLGVAVALRHLMVDEMTDFPSGAGRIGSPGGFVAATLLFLARDIVIMHVTTLDGRARRGVMAALIYLAILYVLLPLLLSAVGQTGLLPLLLPGGDAAPALGILGPAVELALVGLLFAWNWRSVERRMAVG